MNQKDNNKSKDPIQDENKSQELVEKEEKSLTPSEDADSNSKDDTPVEPVEENIEEEVVEEKEVKETIEEKPVDTKDSSEESKEKVVEEKAINVDDSSDEPKGEVETEEIEVDEVDIEVDTKEEVEESEKVEEKNEDKSENTEEEFDTSNISFGENKEDQKLWYVINTYSGYEDNVCQALKQRIESLNMEDQIFDVIVPKEKKVEIKNGKKKIVEKKIFPGYVLVQMNVNEDSWYVVRNTPSVTGFIGFGNTPTALSVDEVKNIQKRMGIEEPEFKIDYEIGESVKINDGPFKDFDGVISDIDKVRGKIKVLVSMFGRETPVELDALQIQRI